MLRVHTKRMRNPRSSLLIQIKNSSFVRQTRVYRDNAGADREIFVCHFASESSPPPRQRYPTMPAKPRCRTDCVTSGSCTIIRNGTGSRIITTITELRPRGTSFDIKVRPPHPPLSFPSLVQRGTTNEIHFAYRFAPRSRWLPRVRLGSLAIFRSFWSSRWYHDPRDGGAPHFFFPGFSRTTRLLLCRRSRINIWAAGESPR